MAGREGGPERPTLFAGGPPDGAPPEWAWNVLVVATYVPVAIGSAGWIVIHQGLEGLRAASIGDSPARDLAAGVIPALVVVAASRWAARRFAWSARMERALARVVGPVSWGTCFVLAASSAVGEELLFRGVLQPHLGLIATSLLFAAVHVPVDRDLALWPSFALAAGLLLGGLFQATDALLAPVACHFVINLLNLRALSRAALQVDEDGGVGFFQ